MAADWNRILGAVVPQSPTSLDDLLGGDTPPPVRGKLEAPSASPPPSSLLWQRALDAPSYVGIRITETPSAPDRAAIRLAAMAIERSVEPIILSRVDASGFERFGLRVERLPDDDAEAAAAEEELRKFWDLAIIIDGRDLEYLT